MGKLTPLMEQYLELKEKYKDYILFYRLGDFYEMFFEDAITCSKVLEITLTGKSCGLEERAPMCGVPYHSVDSYLSKMIANGYKVAICEQIEDPKLAKGLVKRDVIRIVTPGTNLNTQDLDETKNNYLMCILYTDNAIGIASVDVTTGDFLVTEVDSVRKLMDEINKLKPSEIICNEGFFISSADIDFLRERMRISISALESRFFDETETLNCLKEHFRVANLEGLGLSDFELGSICAGGILLYLYETQKSSMSQLNRIQAYCSNSYMLLDSSTRRNLEITETMRDKQKRGSLLWVLDKTKTAMGARRLRTMVEQPLIEVEEIVKRQDAVEELNASEIDRAELVEYLMPIYDLERLISKVSYQTANPRDLLALKQSIGMIPAIREHLKGYSCALLKEACDQLDELKDIFELLDRSIKEEPPISVRDGDILKEGYHEEVDQLRLAKTEGKNWLTQLEEKEKARTGIKNLRVKYNKVFGYYLEVTNSFKNLVPADWVRKQTLANAERYTTDELKKLEDIILGAEDKLFNLEYNLFVEIRMKLQEELERIQKVARIVANIDALVSMAVVSSQNHYVRPVVDQSGALMIKEGRHPVVERMIPHEMFVANDAQLDNREHCISIITGPNMAGKSTYMRQTALIVLMAQIGCFVPAKEARIGICDRIFTRVGASDDLASGQSTFMVEMTEVANILRNATKESLIVLDEIGRGTSTFDGLSIAWAVVEYISGNKDLCARTLFATHYHELTQLEGKLDNVMNYCIAVKEQGEDIIFLRKIIKGGADKSYGIQVAKLAGVPEVVLKRAREIADSLAENEEIRLSVKKKAEKIKPSKKGSKDETVPGQMSLFDMFSEKQSGLTVSEQEKKALDTLRKLDLSNMTPIEAMNRLYELQKSIDG